MGGSLIRSVMKGNLRRSDLRVEAFQKVDLQRGALQRGGLALPLLGSLALPQPDPAPGGSTSSLTNFGSFWCLSPLVLLTSAADHFLRIDSLFGQEHARRQVTGADE